MIANKESLNCWIYEQGIKDAMSEIYGLNCKGENINKALGYKWVISKVPPCNISLEECGIQSFIDSKIKDYICEIKRDCSSISECTLDVIVSQERVTSCKLIVKEL